jgi:hypothetical protein
MGKADNWQVKILDFLKGKEEEYIVLNWDFLVWKLNN